MPETECRSISVVDVEVFYRQAGNVDVPTVLLLHGFPSSSFQFRHMLGALSGRWNLVAPDLLGFGFTKVGSERRSRSVRQPWLTQLSNGSKS